MKFTQNYTSFNDAFYNLIKNLYENPQHVVCPRGMEVCENLFANFSVSNIRNRKITLPSRKWSEKYYFGELIWYLSGSNRLRDIQDFSSFWNKISDDGSTLNSAYGSRIFKPHPKVADSKTIQWDYVKNTLKKDLDSRQAVIQIRTPSDTIEPTKDMPCTLDLQFLIRNGKMDLIAHKRSTDIIFGLCFDAPIFMTLQEMMAIELGVEPGTYYHLSNSLHLYSRHYEMAESIIKDDIGDFNGEYPAICAQTMWENAMNVVNTKQYCQASLETLPKLDFDELESYLKQNANITCPFFKMAQDSIVNHYRELNRKS